MHPVPSWPWQRDEGVSDVLGSILLVGITVVMAAAFGAILLAYDGPADSKHTQLELLVGSGPDLDWGPNDAELRIRHLGGERLRDKDVRILYKEVGGVQQSIEPTFAGGRLVIGQSWSRTISAFPGDVIPVTVVVKGEGISQVVQSSDVPAGGAVNVVLTYVSTNTPTRGSVTNFNSAKAANDNGATATVLEGALAPGSTSLTYTPNAATQSGASSNQVRLSDNLYGSIDQVNDRVQGEGFTLSGTPFAVTGVTMGVEGKGTAGSQAVALVSTTTGTAGPVGGSTQVVGTVATATTIVANSALVYTAAIAHGDNLGTDRTVTGVAGLGLTWTQVQTIATSTASSGRGRLDVWVGNGVPTGTTAVTATFSGLVEDAIIEVNGWSGVDPSSPIQNSATAVSGGSTAISVGPVTGTATYGRFVAVANVVAALTGIFSAPSTNLAEVDKDEVHLSMAHGPAAASNTASGLAAVSVRWQAIGFTLRPQAITTLPTVRLSYHLTPSGTAGTTGLTPAFTTTDADYTVAITADRAWVPADFGTLSVRATVTAAPTVGAGGLAPTVDIDRVYVTVTTTNGPTTYQLDVQMDWPTPAQVPTFGTHYLQIRYTTSVDTFTVEARSGTGPTFSWRSCGTLSSTTPTDFVVLSCKLLTPETVTGVPVIRIRDIATAGTTQGTLQLDYVRVSST